MRNNIDRDQDEPHAAYFLNFQTDGPVSSDIFQHKLFLEPHNEWQNLCYAFEDFTLTNKGQRAKKPILMMQQAIRTLGISCLADAEGYQGRLEEPFDLQIDRVVAIPEESISHLGECPKLRAL